MVQKRDLSIYFPEESKFFISHSSGMLMAMAVRGEQLLIPRIAIHGELCCLRKRDSSPTYDQGYAHTCQPMGLC